MEFPIGFFDRKDVVYKNYAGYSKFQARYQQELSKLDSSCEFLWVPTRFGPTHLVVAGPKEAPPLFLLHGLDENAMIWKQYIEVLKQRYRVYAPDIIGGLGKSSVLIPSLNGPDYGLWLGDLLYGLTISQASFIGSRGGCHSIFKLANLDISRFKKVVLINPYGLTDPKPAAYITTRLPQYLFASLLFEISPSWKNALRVIRLIAANPLELDKEGVRQDLENFVDKKYLRMGAITANARGLPTHELTQLTAPVLMILSERDANYDAKRLTDLGCECFPG